MGAIALLGGDEFLPECLTVDKELLSRVAGYRPRVAILPTAAAPGDPGGLARKGVEHFEALGAAADAVMVLSRADADNRDLIQGLREADLIYLSSGDPWYLLETARDSLLLATLTDLLRQDRVIAGSGGGAMALAQWMRGRTSWSWQRGLGLAEGIAVLPHHERFPRAQVDPPRHNLASDVALLGIDSATGCISSREDWWDVCGLGAVTVYSAGSAAQYTQGGGFSLGWKPEQPGGDGQG